jgi:N6-L-threonylcarbamoyladenine synthase
VAKFLGFLPGGPEIDRSPKAPTSTRSTSRAVMKNQSLDFSFSGLKTAVRIRATRDGLAHGSPADAPYSPAVRNIVASFQRTVVETLVATTLKACRREGVSTVLLAGGVACNRRLRAAFDEAAAEHGLAVFMPSRSYTTDNAAMIGAAAFLHYEREDFAPLDVNADANLKLGA